MGTNWGTIRARFGRRSPKPPAWRTHGMTAVPDAYVTVIQGHHYRADSLWPIEPPTSNHDQER